MKMFILENGLRVVVVEMNHLHTVEVGLYIKTGSINDPKGKEGLSHFTEHMVFRGTELCPSEHEINVEFEKVGGNVNASTDEEVTCYHSNCHPTTVARTMELIASLVTKPLLQDFKIEKKIVLQEIYESMNNRKEYVGEDEVLRNLMWKNHPFGTPVLGTLNSIRKMHVTDIKSHISNYYNPTNSVLVVTGNVVFSEVMKHSETYFGKWIGENQDFPIEDYSLIQSEPVSRFVANDTMQFQICFGFRSYSRSNLAKMRKSHFLSFTMGESSSKIQSRLRSKEGLVYGLYTACNDFLSAGSLQISLMTDSKNFGTAISRTFDEINSLSQVPIIDEDFDRFKKAYLFKIDYSQDMPSSLNIRYGYGVVLDCLRTIEDDKNAIIEMSPNDIMKTANEIFKPANLNLAVIGPYSRKDINSVSKILESCKNGF